MNKFFKLFLIIIILVTGCKRTNINNKEHNQFINNFDMNIYSNDGEKLFSIKSPYSKYETNNNIFNLKETTINLFNNNEIQYIIKSDKSKFSNNILLELNGNVLVNNNINKEDKLFANNFSWNTKKSEYLLIGNVHFKNKNIILSSNKAILNNTSNIIEFFNPVKYIIKDNEKERRYEINSENAYYNINTNSVSFKSNEKRVRSKIYF